MKITDLRIEQFCTWRNLDLKLPDQGVNVFYGPNEAGKSTLLDFVRGVLYGFVPPDRPAIGQVRVAENYAGSIEIEREGKRSRVHRAGSDTDRGYLTLSDNDELGPPEDRLKSWLNGVDRTFFEHVYALGLGELQELSTLHEGEVAARIYGLTLGPDGQRLIQSSRKLDKLRHDLSHVSDKPGRDQYGKIEKLLEQREQLSKEIRNLDKRHKQYRELLRTREKLDEEILELRRRLAGLQEQLRGHMLLQQVYAPWRRVRNAHEELETLPEIESFPDDGVERLTHFEQSVQTLTSSYHNLRQLSKEAREEYKTRRLDRALRARATTVTGLLEWEQWVTDVHQRIATQTLEVDRLTKQLDEKLTRMGPGWSSRRLDLMDTSPQSHFKLSQLARSFKSALGRRDRCQRKLDRRKQTVERWAGELQEQLDGLGIPHASAGLQEARLRLEELKDYSNLRIREQELRQRLIGLDEQRERLEARLVLPGWVYVILWLFGLGGIGLMIVGLLTGFSSNPSGTDVQTSRIVGGIFAFLGLSCAGLSLAIKSHFERAGRARSEFLDDEAFGRRNELAQLRERIRAIQDACGISADLLNGDQGNAEAALAEAASLRIADYTRLALKEKRLVQLKNQIEAGQKELEQAEQEVRSSRQNWRNLLGELGFPAQLRIDEVLATWQQMLEAKQLLNERDAALREQDTLRNIVQGHDQKILDLNASFERHRHPEENPTPPQILAHWNSLLETYRAQKAERRHWYRTAVDSRRDARRLRPALRREKERLQELLHEHGAADPEDFRQRARDYSRRQELLVALDEARTEVTDIATNYSDLAIVEDDLVNFDREKNSRAIDLLQREIADLQGDLEESSRRQGQLAQEMLQLETDRQAPRLRWDLARIDGELQQASQEWCTLNLTEQVMARVRGNFERTCQPVTLADASRYLSRLTGGRYRNIWTPLGQRDPHVDDEQRQTWNVQQLSRGTREQLFLSIRLAIVQQLGRQGINLPMVLDDVFVNFDEQRTLGAIDLLIDFTKNGQQLLFFTCHRYLAELFESRGIVPILLPTPQELSADDANRRAG